MAVNSRNRLLVRSCRWTQAVSTALSDSDNSDGEAKDLHDAARLDSDKHQGSSVLHGLLAGSSEPPGGFKLRAQLNRRARMAGTEGQILAALTGR